MSVGEPDANTIMLAVQFVTGGEGARLYQGMPAETVAFLLRDLADRIERRFAK